MDVILSIVVGCLAGNILGVLLFQIVFRKRLDRQRQQRDAHVLLLEQLTTYLCALTTGKETPPITIPLNEETFGIGCIRRPYGTLYFYDKTKGIPNDPTRDPQ